MTKQEEIKNRIDLINRGEVPEGYKKEHGYNFPISWNLTKLKNICTKKIDKARNKNLETLSITAGTGFVNQAEKFGRELSGKQYENYTIIKNGDFSYNKGNSKRYPQGCICLLQDRIEAAVPNVFNTFRLNKECCINDYYKHLFTQGFLNNQLHKRINSGVRNDGLLNLYEDDFYSVELPLPALEEQKKIAEILNCCDKVIELKQKLLDEMYKQLKIFTYNLIKNAKGNLIEIGEILNYEQPTKYIVHNQYKDKQKDSDIPVLTANKGFIKGYTDDKEGIFTELPVIIFDDFTVDNKFVNFPFKVQSSAIKFLTPKNKQVNLLYVYKSMSLKNFKAKDHKRYYLSEYQYLPIKLPNIEVQNKTVDILSQADKELELLEQELNEYKTLKKSLAQLLLTGIVRVNEV